MTWIFENQELTTPPEDAVGFVYCIVNLINGKKYIGKKLLSFAKTTYKTVTLKNGKKKKKKIRGSIESDWKDYWSSSDELKADVASLGSENFSRTILKFCYSKNELSYYEAKYQFEQDVLLHEDQWYNGWISVRVRRFKQSSK